MKINRYPIGKSNVQQLQRAAASVKSPDFMASREGGKYFAVADAADSIGRNVNYLQEIERRTVDAEDNSRVALAEAEAKTQRQLAREQAKAEGWSPERLVERDQEIARNFMDTLGQVSDRNRNTYARQMGQMTKGWLESTTIEASVLRAQNARARADVSFDTYVSNGLYNEALKYAAQQRDLGIYNADEVSAKALDVSARQEADSWAEKYQKAIARGTEDKVLQEMGEADPGDAVWAYFTKQAQQINTSADAVRAQINTERSIEWNDFKAGITSTTTRDEVKGWIRERPWLNNDQRNGLFNALEKGETTKQLTLDLYSDREAKATRRAFNSELNPNLPPEENSAIAAKIAQTYRVVPEGWSNMVNTLASSEEPSDLARAGEFVRQMQKAAPGINMHLNDNATMKTQMYIDTVTRTQDPISSASIVSAHFADVNEQTVEARKERWENEDYGPDGKSPKDFIFDELTRRLSDMDTPVGTIFAGDLGGSYFDLNRADPYDRKTVKHSPLMEDTLQDLAYRFYTAGASEEVAIESAIRAARNMGFAATDVNYGVPWAGDVEHKYQIQQNPITRQGEQVIPQEQIRDIIQADIQNLEYIRVNDAPGTEPRKYDIWEIEIGDGIVDEIEKLPDGSPNPNYGKLKWPLLARGSQLTLNGYPQYWWFDPEPAPDSQPGEASETEAISRIQRGTLESRLQQLTGGGL